MAHIGHNVLTNFLDYESNDKVAQQQFEWYYNYNQTKIVVITSLDKIEHIKNIAFLEHIGFSMVDDVKYGYPICAVVGPVTQDEAVTLGLDKLRLYRG